jgi:hypothetical protein
MSTKNSQIIPQITFTHINPPFFCKLDRDNFIDWKFQVHGIVNKLGLIDYLCGLISAPSTTIASAAGTSKINPNYHIWYMQDQILLG